MAGPRRLISLISLAFPFLLAASLLTGCGGGEEDASTAVTKSQFVGQAQSICQDAKAEKEQAVSQALEGGEPSKQDLEGVVEDRIVPAYRKMLSRLTQLEAPAGEEQAVETMVAKYESALEDTEAQPLQLIEGDPFSKAESAAQEYGLKACVF
jgi:hypothetical protein